MAVSLLLYRKVTECLQMLPDPVLSIVDGYCSPNPILPPAQHTYILLCSSKAQGLSVDAMSVLAKVQTCCVHHLLQYLCLDPSKCAYTEIPLCGYVFDALFRSQSFGHPRCLP